MYLENYNGQKPYLFGGPSLKLWSKSDKTDFNLYPPIKRGDLDPLLKKPPGICIIIDGLFGAELSISPTECRALLEKGWMLLGSSSMGALRAADLWSLGMIGIGDIYMMYRLGKCMSDADVAVAYDAKNFNERTISLVHLRYVLNHLVQTKKLALDIAIKIYNDCKAIKWFARSFISINMVLEKYKQSEVLFRKSLLSPNLHPKAIDALKVRQHINSILWI